MGQGHPKKISTGQNINPTKTFKSLSPCPLNYKEIRNHNIFQKIKFLIINNKNSKFLSRRLSPDKIEQISPKASIIIPQDSKRKRFNSLNVERALETSQSPNKINRLSIKNNNSYSSFKNIKENDFLKSHRKKSSMFETLNILQQIRPVMSEKMRASLNNSKHNKKFIRKTAFEEEIIKPCESEKKMGDFLKRRKVQSVSEHLQDGSCHFKSPLIAKTQQEGYGGESLFANETTLIKNYALYLNEKKEKKKNERESSLQHKTATKHFINVKNIKKIFILFLIP